VGDGLPARVPTSAAPVSLRAIRVGGQVADWRLAENTILGISFMGAAIGWSELGQNLAISSWVTRPLMWVPACRSRPAKYLRVLRLCTADAFIAA
jgi:hypothetical protein